MRVRLARAALYLVALLSVEPARADDYVTCVQTQLSSLGIDVGAIDGIPGRRTRAGLDQIIPRDARLGKLPRLDLDNASVWCGEIGRTLYLRDVWPSSSQPYRLETEQGIVASKRGYLEWTMGEARKFLVSTLEVDIPGTLVVVASTDLNQLADMTARELGEVRAEKSIRNALKNQCKEVEIASGVSFHDVIALCLTDWWKNDDAWTDHEMAIVKDLVAHEFTHEFQRQIVGRYGRFREWTAKSSWGPRWLAEGIAVTLGLQFAYPDFSMYRHATWFRRQQAYKGTTLSSWSSKEVRGGKDAEMHAAYAGTMLAYRRSNKAFAEFWRETPKQGWKKAFELAFAQTIDEFLDTLGD